MKTEGDASTSESYFLLRREASTVMRDCSLKTRKGFKSPDILVGGPATTPGHKLACGKVELHWRLPLIADYSAK